jgi:L-alanine-DL-glutamate epimerase-like enolase superfamily enzyme
VAAGLLFVPFSEQIMPDTILPVPADLRGDLAISEIKSTIADVPTVRKHKLSSLSVTAQSYVIVELRLVNGVIGIGEAATLGGPRWSEESVESIEATIDTYLAPALVGAAAERFQAVRARMTRWINATISRRPPSRALCSTLSANSWACRPYSFWAVWCVTACR